GIADDDPVALLAPRCQAGVDEVERREAPEPRPHRLLVDRGLVRGAPVEAVGELLVVAVVVRAPADRHRARGRRDGTHRDVGSGGTVLFDHVTVLFLPETTEAMLADVIGHSGLPSVDVVDGYEGDAYRALVIAHGRARVEFVVPD